MTGYRGGVSTNHMKSIKNKTAIEYLIYQLNKNNNKLGPKEAIEKINSYYKPIAKQIEKHRLYKAFNTDANKVNWYDFINKLEQADNL